MFGRSFHSHNPTHWCNWNLNTANEHREKRNYFEYSAEMDFIRRHNENQQQQNDGGKWNTNNEWNYYFSLYSGFWQFYFAYVRLFLRSLPFLCNWNEIWRKKMAILREHKYAFEIAAELVRLECISIFLYVFVFHLFSMPRVWYLKVSHDLIYDTIEMKMKSARGICFVCRIYIGQMK